MTLQAFDRFLAGTWRDASGAAHIPVTDPATEATIAQVRECSAADVDVAAKAAAGALEAWRSTPAHERADALRRLAGALRARSETLAATLCAEVGMPIKLVRRIQVGLPIATFEATAASLASHAFETRIGHSLVVREPAGVVAAITPWNYPLHQIAAKVAPALAMGCTVVLKPSELTPLNAFLLAEAVGAAGFPAGVFNLVTGAGATVGEALVSHPAVDLVSFTGSTATGRRILASASRAIKRVRLELGGKSASLVLPGADLDRAVRATVASCLLNAGQTCSALTRLIVPEDRAAEATAAAVRHAEAFRPGDPKDEACRLGPVVSAAQRTRILDQVRQAVADGAALATGGPDAAGLPSRGFYVAPTVLTGVVPGAAIAQEEVFGPVLSILTCRSVADGIAIANDSRYGLAGAVWAASTDEALAAARRIRTGQVEVNGAPFNPSAPFGGFKLSGMGRELGVHAFDDFVELKSIQLPEAG